MTQEFSAELWTQKLQQASESQPFLLTFDFDGTLSPLVDDPAAARALPEAQQALDILAAHPRIRLAIITGRQLADITQRLKVPAAAAVSASHGSQYQIPVGFSAAAGAGAVQVADHELSAAAQVKYRRLGAALDELVVDQPGAWIEKKTHALVLHVRTVEDPSQRETTLQKGAELGQSLDVPRMISGNNVVEFSFHTLSKASAITRLRELTAASSVCFVGDDVTDEDGFGALGSNDLGIKVGSAPTIAAYRLADPQKLAETLRGWTEALPNLT